jgi:hypothetical protein
VAIALSQVGFFQSNGDDNEKSIASIQKPKNGSDGMP